MYDEIFDLVQKIDADPDLKVLIGGWLSVTRQYPGSGLATLSLVVVSFHRTRFPSSGRSACA